MDKYTFKRKALQNQISFGNTLYFYWSLVEVSYKILIDLRTFLIKKRDKAKDSAYHQVIKTS